MIQSATITGHDNARAIIYILVGILAMCIMDGVAKWLVHADYAVTQIIALRSWMMVGGLLVWARFNGGVRARLKTLRGRDHAIRVILGFGAPLCFFTAIGAMPLADAVVICFSAPFIMTALSVPLFGERVGIHRWSAIAIGFLGVVMVMQPGTGAFHPMAIVALIACISYASMNLTSRWLGSTEDTFKIVFYLNLGLAVLASLYMPFVFTPMPWMDILLLVGMAVLSIGGHVFMTKAFNTGEIGVIAPFEYSAMIWAVLIGFIFWGDVPTPMVWAGAAIIVASGLYILPRERKKTPPLPEPV